MALSFPFDLKDLVQSSSDGAFLAELAEWVHHFWEERGYRTSKKVVYFDKFSVIANASQASADGLSRPTNFVRSGQIFKRTADKIRLW